MKEPPSSRTSDEQRLLLGEKGLTAFIVAEMENFLNKTVCEFDAGERYGVKWTVPVEDRNQYQVLQINMENGEIETQEYHEAKKQLAGNASEAVELLVNATTLALAEGFQETGLFSALGSAILFFRDYYRRTATLVAACERVGLSDYDVAHHITDMYHHLHFRGAYTKTLAPSGVGEVAARRALGLLKNEKQPTMKTAQQADSPIEIEGNLGDNGRDPDDECLLWSPTTPGLCLHWKSDDTAWRQKRFERIQMEGTRDPRRGGSGTTRWMVHLMSWRSRDSLD